MRVLLREGRTIVERTVDGGPADRVVLADTAADYPVWRAAGGRAERGHDLGLVEALLLGHEGRRDRPRSPAAAWARLVGAVEPPDPPPAPGPGSAASADRQTTLFDLADDLSGAPLALSLEAVVAVHADQERRIRTARVASPGFALLAAAESAGALAAVEMTERGLPWDAAVHDAVLTAALGPRTPHGVRPARLQALAEQLAELLGVPRLNPDSQPELLRALRRAGLPVTSTRSWVLQQLDHPVTEPLLQYKKLSRLLTANGWIWREAWVRDGRLRPEYLLGSVATGRWATRGGGALQIPRVLRAAVTAPPGRVLVAADAGQLEPRVLAALSRDPALVAATRAPDLYAALATEAFGRPDARSEAKIGLLASMYGGGASSPAHAALRRRFPVALRFLEDAADVGEDGGGVRSALGRTSPATGWTAPTPDEASPTGTEPGRGRWQDEESETSARRRRARGRFTRNFVIQASAADWAAVLVAVLRGRLRELAGDDAGLVLFQHDEVVVEAPADLADAVTAAIERASAEATRLVLGDTGVRVPLDATAVRSYAEKP